MSDELRAAANVLAELDLGLYQSASADDALIRPGIRLARAWLAEHPADSDEPVSEAWLRSVGFIHATEHCLQLGIVRYHQKNLHILGWIWKRRDPVATFGGFAWPLASS